MPDPPSSSLPKAVPDQLGRRQRPVERGKLKGMSDHDHTPAHEWEVRDAALDETVEATFPASDPPSTLPNPYDDSALERRDDNALHQ
jgi:hypothetical protein